MINFTPEEIKILEDELLDDIRVFNVSLEELEEGEEFDASMFSMLTTAKYLLSNINELNNTVNLMVLKHWTKFYDSFDDEVHEKYYTKEENRMYQKILNCNPKVIH